jgi:hypothetical protein
MHGDGNMAPNVAFKCLGLIYTGIQVQSRVWLHHQDSHHSTATTGLASSHWSCKAN